MSSGNENSANGDWCVYCSDDEKYEVTQETCWEPEPGDIVTLMSLLEASRDKELQLDWQCPERRGLSPTPSQLFLEQEAAANSKVQKNEKDDFDFMDELSSTKFTRTDSGGPKGSAKKKTTSLDGVLSNMRRHGLMDKQNAKS